MIPEKLAPYERALVAAARMPADHARRVLMLICEAGMRLDKPEPISEGAKHYAKREPYIKAMRAACDRVLNYAKHETLRNIEKHFRESSVASAAEGDSPDPIAIRLAFDKTQVAGELADALKEEQQAALDAGGQQVYDEIGLDNPWTTPAPAAADFIASRENLFSGATDEIHAEVMQAIQDGLDAGETRKELMARINAAFDGISQGRAETIANTETAAAFNYSRDRAMKVAGVTHKKWLHSMSPLIKEPRPTHLDADGQVVPYDEPFDVSGVKFMYPADDSLGAGPEDIINCHCVAIPVEAPIRSGDQPGHEFHGNQWTGGIGGHKTASEISGVIPEDAPLKTFTAYHVTKRENVDHILKNGFDLNKVKPRWINDYAVSLSRGRKAATAYFTSRGESFNANKYALLEVKGKGRLFADRGGFRSPIEHGVASDPRDYTRRMIARGYDGHDIGGTIFVHNPKSLTNIKEVSPE